MSATVLVPAAVALVGVFGTIFSLSPKNGEDYALGIPPGTYGAYERFNWALHRSIVQITGWNARLGEQLAIFWLSMPKTYFVAANILTFIIFCCVVTWLALRKATIGGFMRAGWLATAALILLVWPRLELFFWGTVVAGYFFPLTLTLLVLLPFALPDRQRILTSSGLVMLLLTMSSLCAGLAFENLPPAILAYMALTLSSVFRRRDHDRWRLTILAVAYAVGWSLLMTAPSTAHRVKYYREVLHVPPWSVSHLVDRVVDVSHVFVATSWQLLSLFLIAVGASLFNIDARRRLVGAIPLLITAALSLAAVVMAPYTEPRAFSFCWTVMLVVIIGAVMCAAKVRVRTTSAAIVGVATLAIIDGTLIAREYEAFGDGVEARTRYILSSVGTERCEQGLRISAIDTSASPRVLNNREGWVVSSIDQVSHYFGCKLEMTR